MAMTVTTYAGLPKPAYDYAEGSASATEFANAMDVADGKIHHTIASMYLNAAQSFTAGDNVINLDTDLYDPDGITNTGTYLIKPTRAGYYMVSGNVHVSDLPSPGSLQCNVMDQTSTFMAYGVQVYNSSGGANYFSANCTVLFYFDGSNTTARLVASVAGTGTIHMVTGPASTRLSVFGPF